MMSNSALAKYRQRMNEWGAARRPFLFLLDFEQQQPRLWALDEIKPDELLYDFHGQTNSPKIIEAVTALEWQAHPVSPEVYQKAFLQIQQGLHRGDSFLTNLTFPTPITLNADLREVFHQTEARYRLWYKDHFVSFSPEIFVQIRDNRIYSFPMKGTLPTAFPGSQLLNDPKETAEHATIVDLIRNDLSQVAQRVRVERYRYLEEIHTAKGALWQTSSEIAGNLPEDFHENLGDILLRLLPAGSISGAPKPSTLQMIREAEGQERGYYTGIAALWNGYELDSCVLIRFIEEGENDLRYWSGGGITVYSNWEEEYKELKEKVYLPTKTVNNQLIDTQFPCTSEFIA